MLKTLLDWKTEVSAVCASATCCVPLKKDVQLQPAPGGRSKAKFVSLPEPDQDDAAEESLQQMRPSDIPHSIFEVLPKSAMERRKDKQLLNLDGPINEGGPAFPAPVGHNW